MSRHLYECVNCGQKETVSQYDHRIDGRICKRCNGHSTFIGGVDFANGRDETIYQRHVTAEFVEVADELVCESCGGKKSIIQEKYNGKIAAVKYVCGRCERQL